MINVNPSKEFEMPEYLKEAVAGSREKDLRWLEPYEGKLSSTVPRGEFSGKYLSPLNSYSFKRIFGTEKNKGILIHFLNDILGLTDEAKIENVQFLNPIQNPDIAAKKENIVDVLCRDSKGVQTIVEMQVARTTGFEKRAQYYAAKAYSSQADVGGQYQDLKEVVFIAITDFILFPNKPEYKSDHVTLDRKTFEHDLKDFSFTFIELPKFPKTQEDQLENIVEKWCYFFRYAGETREEDLDKIVGSDVIIKRAYEEMNKFNWSEEELLAYEQRKKRIMDEIAAFAEKFDEGLRLGQEKGRLEGIQIGHQKGRAEGIQIGAEKGEKQAKITVAKNLLKAGFSTDIVYQATGLSADEYENKDLS
ncbi:PD-(D/E)XK nuclease family transposase [Wolbachia endosymbiont of Armadillidium vulgare str. wVulC]|uniref:Rpn family recombination-promoting nuclease/putative transposase n=1 Tax=Wolbachia endosymbiont of Armadillidium vulgare TaxID=77039 RepID=UPI0006D4C485|nr:Rpn family recombination-promoting nuclease/putative transposase [Wolbachia endosymbiont of Armadillidium vulgare]KLT21813.1 PD-(D/E)XK nuclease family transposase [Wolbachia endosymbiont of Armadillidium vulgare str. wVulC]